MRHMLRYLLMLVSILIPTEAGADDFPKSGEAEYVTYYVSDNPMQMESGDAKSGIANLTGITRTVNGPGPFNDMSVQCFMHWSIIGGKWNSRGSCVETDSYIVGGTKKYRGVTGQAYYSAEDIHDTVTGKNAFIVRHNVKWEKKSAGR